VRAAAAPACLVLTGSALAQGAAATAQTGPPAAKDARSPRGPLQVEQRAIELIKAASASARTAAATTSASSAGVAAGSAGTGAACSSSYAAGTAAAAAPPPGASVPTVTDTTASDALGVSRAALPPGAMAVYQNGTTDYLGGNTWFQSIYGDNGMHGQVAAAS
jgi:hypothetical protein